MFESACIANMELSGTLPPFLYNFAGCETSSAVSGTNLSYKYRPDKMTGIVIFNEQTTMFSTNENLFWKSVSYARIKDISLLEDNWNGYEGKSFSSNVISLAQEVISLISKQPDIYPTGRGTIHMQYELPNRSYLEFEIYEDKIAYLEVPERVYKKAIMRQFSKEQVYEVSKIVDRFHGGRNRCLRYSTVQ